jgi:GNAT superfamily N-acetyltransferase
MRLSLCPRTFLHFTVLFYFFSPHFSDEETLELTASERLTLPEELEMCDSWANDEDKATFIICDKQVARPLLGQSYVCSSYMRLIFFYVLLSLLWCRGGVIWPALTVKLPPFRIDDPDLAEGIGAAAELSSMVGDVNLFPSSLDEDDDDNVPSGEIDVMIGSRDARRRGLAASAVRLVEAWASTALGIRRLTAKIKTRNAPSIALFTKLGYVETKRVEVFDEIHFEKNLQSTTNF